MNPIKTIAAAVVAVAALGALAVFAAPPAQAQEAVIRKNLGERVPSLQKIDEVSRTPMNGLWEVRIGTDILYTDAEGNFLINGSLIDARQKRNLTEERVDKLSAIDFDELPVKDAFTIVRGNGKRRMAVFEDPNCGYCKRFERDLQKVDNVTIHMFLYPILGGDSPEKTRNIWCSKDNTTAWRDWMLNGTAPARSMGQCDTGALARNVAMSKKFRVNGTPALVFEDGKRVPGAMSSDQVEKQLVLSRAKG